MKKHHHTKLFVEQLELRELLTSGVELQIGGTTEFRYQDSDGDAIVVKISGTAGKAQFLENANDGIGNDDGVLEDGEELGRVLVTHASADFELSFTHDDSAGTGDGKIHLGSIDARNQIIAKVFTEKGHTGQSQFILDSYAGDSLLPGGGLFVDAIQGDSSGTGILLQRLFRGATVEARDQLHGNIHISGHLAGIIHAEGLWTGNLNVGGNFLNSGQITSGSHVRGNVTILGRTLGDASITGWASGKWILAGHVGRTAHLHAGAGFTNLNIVRNLDGALTAGRSLHLDVAGSLSRRASLSAYRIRLDVGESIFGRVHSSYYASVKAGDTIARSARITARSILIATVGRLIERGARLQARRVRTLHVPSLISSGTVIGHAPYVITSPGLYRLADHLVYHGSTGAAIDVQTSGVTIDLQGFAVVGTGGSSTAAVGIRAQGHSYVTIRNGTLRGFQFGIIVDGLGQGSRVENIRAMNNWYFGIWVQSASAIVRNNLILDTGGSTHSPPYKIPIALRVMGAFARVYDNVISGLLRTSPFTRELVAVHVDSAPRSRVFRNVVVSYQYHRRSWGLWVNGGTWRNFGATSVVVEDNVITRLDVAVHFSRAARRSRALADNVLLEVRQPTDSRYGIVQEFVQI